MRACKMSLMLVCLLPVTIALAGCDQVAGPFTRFRAARFEAAVDEYQSGCPNCRALSPIERQKAQSALITLGNDCPVLANQIQEEFDAGRLVAYDYDDGTWGTMF